MPNVSNNAQTERNCNSVYGNSAFPAATVARSLTKPAKWPIKTNTNPQLKFFII